MPPKFIYFDLGNVLLNFDHHQACRQMAELAGLSAEQVYDVVFESGLKWQYETGAFTLNEFHRQFCDLTKTQCDVLAWELAGSAIFKMNHAMLPVVSNLQGAGYRLGLLSNICESHWRYVTSGHYGILPSAFEVHALSFRIGAIKPDPKIFDAAAKLAGVAPAEIFYCDDIPGHVAAAKAAGYDAVLFTTAREYTQDLWKRGVRFNY